MPVICNKKAWTVLSSLLFYENMLTSEGFLIKKPDF